MKTTALVLILMMGLSFANERGNGGDAIRVAGNYYVLDLYEAGVHEEPYFHQQSISRKNVEIAKRKFPSFSSEFQKLFALKLEEIEFVYPGFYNYTIAILESYIFSVIPAKLVELDDHQDTVLEYDKKSIRQLAIRHENTVKISKRIFKLLNTGNQVALIFHELYYATVHPSCITEKCEKIIQSSREARNLTGYIFSEAFHLNGTMIVDKFEGYAAVYKTRIYAFMYYFSFLYGVNFSYFDDYKNGALRTEVKTGKKLSVKVYKSSRYRDEAIGCEKLDCSDTILSEIEIMSEDDIKVACFSLSASKNLNDQMGNYKDFGYVVELNEVKSFYEIRTFTDRVVIFHPPKRYITETSFLKLKQNKKLSYETLKSTNKIIKLSRWYNSNELEGCFRNVKANLAKLTL